MPIYMDLSRRSWQIFGTPKSEKVTPADARIAGGEISSISTSRRFSSSVPPSISLFVYIAGGAPGVSRGIGPAAGTFRCRIRALDLENIEKGLLGLGAIDPYFELSKMRLGPNYEEDDDDGERERWTCVYRSEHIPDIINPYWEPFAIDMERLCLGDPTAPLRIAVWDQEDGSPNKWLGECEVSVEELRGRVSRRGNASREGAKVIEGAEGQEIGLIVVLKADIVDS